MFFKRDGREVFLTSLNNSALKGRVECWYVDSSIVSPLKNSSNILYYGTHLKLRDQ